MFENGLEWIRVDFHLHTHKDKEFKYSGEENSFVKEYVGKLEEEGISIGVITNHNKFDEGEYKAIRRGAKKKDIFILPGVELSVKEGNGIHTLIVFNPDEWLVGGENFIGHFLTEAFAGIANHENKNARCKYDLRNVIEKLNSYGKDYFIIFAHVDQNNGFFSECSDGVMSDIKEVADFSNRIIGLQKVRKKESIERFKKHFGYECACVEGSDPKSIKDIGKGDECYIKIGDYSYEAVKYALIDFCNRINGNKIKPNHGYIKSISFKGGKLNGTILNLSPELNTFIGIRGSGKSSALEVLRYALDLKPSCDVSYKKNLVDVTLGSGGQVIVKIIDKYEKEYEIRRIIGEKANVLDSDGNNLGITLGTIIQNALYFGQKDLSQGTNFEAILLDKLLGERVKNTSIDSVSLYKKMNDAIKSLIDIKNVPDELAELEVKRSNLKHNIGIFEERGVAEKLSKQTAFNLDKQKIESVGNTISNTIERIRSCLESIAINSDMFDGYESKYNTDELEKANTILKEIVQMVENIKKNVDKVDVKSEEYNAILEKMNCKIDSLKDEFAEIKRQINDPKVDIDAFPRLKTDLQKTDEMIKSLSKSLTNKQSFENSFRTALRKRNELLQKQFKKYENEIKKINESQPELLVKMTFKGEREKFKEYLKSDFKGSSIKETKYQLMVEKFTDYAALIEDVLIDGGEKCKGFLTDTEYGKLLDKVENQYEELLEKETPNSVEIFYHDKPLKQHSLGQRASALVLFILSQKENDVVIIDQPEDDLDNKVIFDEVIKAICSKKRDIQFIFATHNANIPVLGDAEKVLAAESSDDIISIDQGNIDNPKTHEQIVSIMEGGQEAFDKRKKIYSTWK